MGCGQSELTESEVSILRLGELVHTSDQAAVQAPGTGHTYLDQAAKHLSKIEDDERDNYSILVMSRHGKQYFGEKDLPRAIESYTKAINLAEIKIAERCRGLYLMLQRYSECMTDIARIWIGSANGELPDTSGGGAAGGLNSLESGGATAISLEGKKMSESAAIKRKKRDEATAEIVLLRCIETIEEGHNRRSDLLIEPLMQLSMLYESLELYSRAELLVRRCIGILIVQYGHDHPKLAESNERLEMLVQNKEKKNEEIAATNIQKTFRMHSEMKRLESETGKKARRHTIGDIERERTPTPPADFLSQLVGQGGEEEGAAGAPEGERRAHSSTESSSTTRPNDSTSHSPGLNSNRGSFFGMGPNDGGAGNSNSNNTNGLGGKKESTIGRPPRSGSRVGDDDGQIIDPPRKPVNPVDAAMQSKPFRGVVTGGAENGANSDAANAPKLWSVPGETGDFSDHEGDDDA